MIEERYIKGMESHLKKAVEKHPFFCTKISTNDSEIVAKDICSRFKNLMDKGIIEPSAKNILTEEVLEIIEAYNAKDYENAIEETYDAIAVLLRVVMFIELKMKNK